MNLPNGTSFLSRALTGKLRSFTNNFTLENGSVVPNMSMLLLLKNFGIDALIFGGTISMPASKLDTDEFTQLFELSHELAIKL